MKKDAVIAGLISVVMPAYKAELTIADAVQSLLSQTYTQWELIIVVEPSPDNTSDSVIQLAQKDRRITILHNDTQLGPAGARNRGLDHVSGEFTAFLDADDMALPDRFEKQVEYLKMYDDVFLVGAGVTTITWNGEVEKTIPQTALSHETIAQELPEHSTFTLSAVMFRTDPQYRFRENIFYAEDWDLYLRMLSDGKKLANIEEPLVLYRLSLSSVTLAFYVWESQQKMLDLVKQWHRERLETGHDSYDTFDKKSIVKELSSQEKKIQEIKLAFRSKHLQRLRTLTFCYLREEKFNAKVLLLFITSFLPNVFQGYIRKKSGIV